MEGVSKTDNRMKMSNNDYIVHHFGLLPPTLQISTQQGLS